MSELLPIGVNAPFFCLYLPAGTEKSIADARLYLTRFGLSGIAMGTPLKMMPSMGAAVLMVVFGLIAMVYFLRKPPSDLDVGQRKAEVFERPEAKRSPDNAKQLSPLQIMAPNGGLTSEELVQEYQANETLADKKYKGKLVLVRGKVDMTGRDIVGFPYVILFGSSQFRSVQCVFSKSDASWIDRMSERDVITLQGRCLGKIGVVLLRECSVQ